MDLRVDGVSAEAIVCQLLEDVTAWPQRALALGRAPTRREECAALRPAVGLARAEAFIASVEREATILGKQLLPLHQPREIVALLEAELMYPNDTPHRAAKLLMELRCRNVRVNTEFELMQLVERLETCDGWAEALASLRVPAEKRCVLLPPVTACAVPGCKCTTLVDGSSGTTVSVVSGACVCL